MKIPSSPANIPDRMSLQNVSKGKTEIPSAEMSKAPASTPEAVTGKYSGKIQAIVEKPTYEGIKTPFSASSGDAYKGSKINVQA
jgi:hypothetical protein